MTRYRKRPYRRRPKNTYPKGFSKFARDASGAVSAAGTIAMVAKKAWNGVKLIRKLINVENNYLDATAAVTNTDFTNAGVVYCLSLTATGDGIGARTGNSIRPQHLEIVIDAVTPATTANIGMRCIVFRDNDGDGALPAVVDVLALADTRSPYEFENHKRFTIMSDNFRFVTPNTSAGMATRFSYNAAVTGHCFYDNTSAAQSSTKQGHFFIMLISDQASGAASPTANIWSRLHYTDN